MGRILLFLLFVLLYGLNAVAQIPNGTWRDHLPYSGGIRIAEIDEKIYCATTGGMFSYNTFDNSIQRYSKVNGLSDIDISTIAYSENTKTLLVAYKNGNLDLIRNDSIYNLPDLMIKTFTGDKSVNSVLFIEDYAFLACGFGMMMVDMKRILIKDTYLFGPGGTQITVNDIAFDGTYLYAATSEGIYKAAYADPNLVDYNAWSRLTELPEVSAEYRHLVFFNGKLFTHYRNEVTTMDNIITIDESGWKNWELPYTGHVNFIIRQPQYLIFSSDYRTDIYDENETHFTVFASYRCRHALIDKNNQIWFADPENGLGKAEPAGNTYITPNGPAYRDVGDIAIESGILWAGGGNLSTRWAGKGAYSFADENWKSYNYKILQGLNGFYNISEVAIDPFDPGHVYGGSLGYGIVEFQDGNLVDIFDETNSILEPVPGFGHGYVNVSGLNFDPSGNLWISTSLSDHPVYFVGKDKKWKKIEFDFPGFGLGTLIGDILPTTFNQQWLVLDVDGILVFSLGDQGEVYERFFIVKNQEDDVFNHIFSVAEDREGNIWVGTSKGPVIYYNPTDIFNENVITGYQPPIPRNDGTPNADLLLATEKITAIAVDGGNRKWLGTENSGVFLVSADGKEELLHFTAANS
ncbi:MAG: hypothetical protein JXR41_13155, partial [Bacteroidales bacterium]|nr:hypothetical protein [Bacteroidales bacterium]